MKTLVHLVDDQKEDLDVLEQILQKRYNTVKNENSEEALQYLLNTAHPPDLVLLNVTMPGMDGYELLRIIKNHHKLHRIPVICITAKDTEQTALSLGAEDYISKPFQPDTVHLRIHNQILLKRHVNDQELLVPG